jgi:AcrR family transcriptional regulator
MNWQRARSDDQIEQRIDTIIEAAATLYSQYRFDEITFAMIGKQAKFTRSNLYRYFKTKEEVFLQLLMHDIVIWRQQIQAEFGEAEQSIDDFPQRWVDLQLQHGRMLRLFSIVYTVIEHNVSDQALLAFKAELFKELTVVTRLFAELGFFASQMDASNFVVTHMSLVSGMYPMLEMPERQKMIMLEIGVLQANEQYRMTLETATRGLFEAFRSTD